MRSPAARWLAPSRLTAIAALLVFTVAAPAWYFVAHRAEQPTVHAPVAMQPSPQFSEDIPAEAIAALTADPLSHYFGIRLAGNTIAYVVDGDDAMAPYIDKLAFLTNSVNAAIAPGTHRYGIIRAFTDNENLLAEVMEPTDELENHRPLLSTKLTPGQTNLANALTMASGWYTDQLFLVLAKQVDKHELRMLTRTAEQTGAVVNVIALGSAAAQSDLSAVSSATGGQFVSIDDHVLDAMVDRQHAAIENQDGRLAGL